jgi:nitrite reductase (NO-forming)
MFSANQYHYFLPISPATLATVLGLALLGACAATPPGGLAAKTAAANPSPLEIRIVASEFMFQPKEFKVKAGAPVNLVLDNSKGAVEHDFTVEALGIQVAAKAGEASSRRVSFDRPGEYQVKCSVPGHLASGMRGKLVVEAPAGADSAQGHQAAAPQEAPSGMARLPIPQAAPPVNRKHAELVKVTLEAMPMTGLLADKVSYDYWTFNGTVPGPMIRVRQGDTVELTLKNSPLSPVTHSIDSHGVTGPGGGAKASQTLPGGTSVFRFKALKPGAYVYHCATPMIPHHISNGMYGLMVVEPPAGWPKVDREFYVMQGEMYLGKPNAAGVHEVSIQKMNDETPDYVVFNGSVGALSKENALKAKVGETVRIFFGVGGPNITSSFHVIGEMFDRLYPEGASEFVTNVQSTTVPTGGAAIVDFKLELPGTYILVDHSLSRLGKGAAGFLDVEGPPNPDIFQPIMNGGGGNSGH